MRSLSDHGPGRWSPSIHVSARAALVGALVAVVIATAAATGPAHFRLAHAEPADSARAHAVRAWLHRGLDSLDADLAAVATAPRRDAARVATRAARARFRELESALDRYAPTLMLQLNSDESSEPDEDAADGFKVRRGFQLLDSAFADDRAPDTLWRNEVARMRLDVARFRPTVGLMAPSERDIIDLARYELARVATLTIAGFDARPSDAIDDAVASLSGVSSLLTVSRVGDSTTARRLDDTRGYLLHHDDFATLDRFELVRRYVNPAFAALAERRRRIGGPEAPVRSTWPNSAGTIYDARALDAMSYAPDNAPMPDSSLTAIGRALFFDGRLSRDGDRSCATCHVPELGFRDARARAVARTVAGETRPAVLRHTPTLINAALQPSQFSDGRRSTLEQQIGDVLANPHEMGGDLAAVVRRVAADDGYASQFAAHAPGHTVSAASIETALASYVRTLRAFDSPFDRAIHGEAELDADARRGFNLFMGRAGCGTCHFAPLFNGTQPPRFVQSEPEVIDVPAEGANESDRDLGRGAIDRRGGLARAFKTPTVRNAGIGGPFMHNGVFRTLDDVIAFYDAGGASRRGARARNVTLAPDSLHLSAADRSDLVAFIASLTDTTGLTRRK